MPGWYRALIDADGLVQASLSGARVDLDTAVAFAAASGLRVSIDGGRPH